MLSLQLIEKTIPTELLLLDRLKSALNLSVLFFRSFKMLGEFSQCRLGASLQCHLPQIISYVFVEKRDNSSFSHDSRCNKFLNSYFCSDNNCSRQDLTRKGKKTSGQSERICQSYEQHVSKQKKSTVYFFCSVRTSMHCQS